MNADIGRGRVSLESQKAFRSCFTLIIEETLERVRVQKTGFGICKNEKGTGLDVMRDLLSKLGLLHSMFFQVTSSSGLGHLRFCIDDP